MSVAQTSIDAYHGMRDAGKVGGQKALVFEAVRRLRKATRKQIADETGLPYASVCGRVNALIHDDGLLQEVPGQTFRNDTGVNAKQVMVADRQPDLLDNPGIRLRLEAIGLCRRSDFRAYLRWRMRNDLVTTEARAAAALKLLCGVDKRSELDTDREAAQRFAEVRAGFQSWRRR